MHRGMSLIQYHAGMHEIFCQHVKIAVHQGEQPDHDGSETISAHGRVNWFGSMLGQGLTIFAYTSLQPTLDVHHLWSTVDCLPPFIQTITNIPHAGAWVYQTCTHLLEKCCGCASVLVHHGMSTPHHENVRP